MESATTTELTRLPGLEVAETKPEVRPEHWIERGPSKRLMLFAGRSHPALAQKIAEMAPLAIGLAKEAVNRAYETSLAEGVRFERPIINYETLWTLD